MSHVEGASPGCPVKKGGLLLLSLAFGFLRHKMSADQPKSMPSTFCVQGFPWQITEEFGDFDPRGRSALELTCRRVCVIAVTVHVSTKMLLILLPLFTHRMKAASAFLSPPLVNCRLDRGPVLSVSLSVDQPVTQGIARASPSRTHACTPRTFSPSRRFIYYSSSIFRYAFLLSGRAQGKEEEEANHHRTERPSKMSMDRF